MPPTSVASGLKQPIRSWNLTDRRRRPTTRPDTRSSRTTCGRSTGSRRRRSSGAAMPLATSSSARARSGPRSTRSRSRPQIMISLAGHVVENRFLDKLTTGPSSDLNYATQAAEDYVGSLAMGPTKLVIPMQPGSPPIGPVLVGAHELLDQLYEETERLAAREGAGRPLPRQGAHRARRADRRRSSRRSSPRSRPPTRICDAVRAQAPHVPVRSPSHVTGRRPRTGSPRPRAEEAADEPAADDPRRPGRVPGSRRHGHRPDRAGPGCRSTSRRRGPIPDRIRPPQPGDRRPLKRPD